MFSGLKRAQVHLRFVRVGITISYEPIVKTSRLHPSVSTGFGALLPTAVTHRCWVRSSLQQHCIACLPAFEAEGSQGLACSQAIRPHICLCCCPRVNDTAAAVNARFREEDQGFYSRCSTPVISVCRHTSGPCKHCSLPPGWPASTYMALTAL
jgi:hypothetical protein